MPTIQEEIESILKTVEKTEQFLGIVKTKLNRLCREAEKSEVKSLTRPMGQLSQKTQARIASKLRKVRKVS